MKKILLILFLFISIVSFGQVRNNNPNVFNVKLFGATGDGVYDTTISISSTSQSVASVNSIFASTDVGKIIVILGAGTSGRDLVGTITAFTNATHVTISATAATSVTNAPTLFGTDQTTSIQAAINACFSAKGGQVFFPVGNYLIAGALKTNVGGINMNSQIYIPATTALLGDTGISIQLVGEAPPNFRQYSVYSGTANNNVYQGVNLISTVTTGASGAAVIGTHGNGGFNYTDLVVQNLTIKVLDNPAGAGAVVGGISYKNGANITVNQVNIMPIGSAPSSVMPTNNLSGIETPDLNSESFYSLSNCEVAGFKSGFTVGEHVVFNQAQAFICYRGITFKDSYHATTAPRVGVYWCTTDIYVAGAAVVQNFVLDEEYMTSGLSGGKWYDNVATITDTANLCYGFINYNLTQAGVGTNNSHFTLNGGAHIIPISDTTPIAILGRSNFINVASTTKSIEIGNTNSSAGVSYLATNNNGVQGFMGSWGSGFSHYTNSAALGSSGQLIVNSDAGVSSSGSNVMDFVTGGFSNTYAMRLTAGNPGNVVIQNKLSIGTTTTGAPLYILEPGGNNNGIRLRATNNAQYISFDFYDDADVETGQFFSTNSGFSSGLLTGNFIGITDEGAEPIGIIFT